MYYQLYLPSSVFNPFTNYENPDNNVWNPYGTRMELLCVYLLNNCNVYYILHRDIGISYHWDIHYI